MNYFLPTKILFGEKSFKQLFSEIEERGFKKPFILCGRHFVSTAKFIDIKEKIKNYSVFVGVKENPSFDFVDFVAKRFNDSGCDAIIAIGGGSTIDTAKVVSVMKNIKSCKQFFGKKNISENSKVPLIALPTASGSGSEATKFAVISDKNNTKRTLSDDLLYPDVAIVDPELTSTCPKSVTAASGLDALSQGIESYWAKNAFEETLGHSKNAIHFAYHNLEKAVFDPDRLSRHNMAFASLEAAKAFSQTGTTAPHTISRAFTKYYGLTHGFGVACTIPWFLEFYYDAMPERILSLCNIIGSKSVEEAQRKITSLIASVGGKTRLRDFGVKTQDFSRIIAESCVNKPQNPKKHTKSDLMRLLGELY